MHTHAAGGVRLSHHGYLFSPQLAAVILTCLAQNVTSRSTQHWIENTQLARRKGRQKERGYENESPFAVHLIWIGRTQGLHATRDDRP